MISIVVPIYKVEKYLYQCLESLRIQTYRDIQVIMVNDGSPDGCKAICEKFCSIDKRFELINKNNAGLGFARNTGLENVKGEYVVFIDSDDYAMPTMIEALVQARDVANADTCIGSYIRVTDDKPIKNSYKQQKATFKGDEVVNLFLPKLLGSCPSGGDSIRMSACNVLYSMKIINANKIRFCSERVYTSEDLFFNLDYYRFSKNIVLIDEPLYHYRINYGSLSYKYRPNRYEMKRKIYVEGLRRLNEIGVNEEAYIRFMKYYFLGIKMCIRQETQKLSGKTKQACIEKIRTICKDDILRDILGKYPIKELGIKQQIFLALVIYQQVKILYFLSEKGVFN